MNKDHRLKTLFGNARDIKATGQFRTRISGLLQERHSNHFRSAMWTMAGLAVGAVLIIVLVLPSPLSARKIIISAIEALDKAQNIELTIDIRTTPREIFEFINPDKDFVTHRLIVNKRDSITYWNIEKSERSAQKNAQGLYVWIKPFDIGWHWGDHEPDVLGYLNILTDPAQILQNELNYILQCKKSDYDLRKEGEEIVLSVHGYPTGEYHNRYVLNTSVATSENIRTYVIDRRTMQLKSLSITLIDGVEKKDILILKNIVYNAASAKLPPVPSQVRFIDSKSDTLWGIPGLTPRETASVLLNSFTNWDTDIIYKYIAPTDAETIYRRSYEGMEVLSIGEPFRSGPNERLIFVPYTIRLNTGKINKMNLALLLSAENIWTFDGGL